MLKQEFINFELEFTHQFYTLAEKIEYIAKFQPWRIFIMG